MTITHGFAGRVEGRRKSLAYKSWMSMRDRCLNPRCHKFPYYGGRGIKICARWDDFANFMSDMGERVRGQSIGRINNDGDYCPENCRWETKAQQAANKSTTRLLTFNGETKHLAEWERQFPNIPVKDRFYKGWDVNRIFSTQAKLINQYSNPLRISALKIWKHCNPTKKEVRAEVEAITRSLMDIQQRIEFGTP